MKDNNLPDNCQSRTDKLLPWNQDDDEISYEDGDSDCEFDSTDNCKWIVAVDHGGNVSVLSKPNIDPSFFENGDSAEVMGMPPDAADVDPGVYEWICSLQDSIDRESGIVDDFWFEVESSKLLWSVENE